MVDSGLPTTFRGYHEVVFGLGSDLQRIEELAIRLGRDGVRENAGVLRRRVQQQRFTVAVLGEFKRGKSTFINALLGQGVLPADIAPTTACINRVVYGLRPSATLYFKDGREPTDVAIDQLEESITKLTEAAAERAAEVSEAVIAWPIRFCSNGIDLLDTPGLADEAAMSEVTRAVLPQVDAALFVIMADSPFSESEGRFLEELLDYDPGRVIFVVTAIDRIRRVADRERLLANIGSRINKRLHAAADRRFPDPAEHLAFLERLGSPRIFGLSGLAALEARQDQDREALEASGLPAFESFLEGFLTTANAVGLRRHLNSAAALCGELLAAGDAVGGASAGQDGEAVLGLLIALDDALKRGLRDFGGRARDRIGADFALKVQQGGLEVLNSVLVRVRLDALKAHNGGTLRAFNLELAESMASKFRRRAEKTVGPALTRLVSTVWVPWLPEASRLAVAADYVLEYARTVSGVETDGPSATQDSVSAFADRLRDHPPSAEDLGVEELVGRLVPTAEELIVALESKAVLEAIAREPATDLLSQFTNVFNTPDKEWSTAAAAAIAQVCSPAGGEMSSVARDGFEARSSLDALVQARKRIRQAELAIETARQRQAALSERDAEDRERDRASALSIQAQASSLAEQLAELLQP